jgi:hypothetical protein
MRFYKSIVIESCRPGYLLRISILLLMMFSFNLSNAQVWINGYLKDKLSQNAVTNAEVRSSLSNTFSDSNGFFRIRVVEGDIISVKKSGYRFHTMHFSFQTIDSSLIIYIEALGSVMKNVTVKSSYSAYQLDSIRRRTFFDESQSKTTFVSKQYHQGFGLVFSLDRLTKSKDRHLKKQKKIFEKTEEWAYIRFRFSDSLVRQYTGLTGDDLHNFMSRYTPSYQWLRTNPSKEEVISYINETMKLFRKENR